MFCSDCGYKFENYDDDECRLCGSTRKSYRVPKPKGHSRKSYRIPKPKGYSQKAGRVGKKVGKKALSLTIRLAIFFSGIILILGFIVFFEISNPMPEYDSSRIESLIVQYTNEERVKHGLASLINDEKLASIARHHSTDMGNRDYFDHTTPEGLEPTDRGNNAGYPCRKNYVTYYTYGIAENIYQGWLKPSSSWHSEESLAKEVVDGWMESPGHRENILDPKPDRIGVGISITQSNAVYVTQNFC